MNYPTQFNVKTAAKDYNSFDMSKIHHTTQDFGVIKPIECKYCIPGDKLNLNISQLTKVLTMPAPTYGRAEMILRAFYVPINNIWKDFNDFISDNKVPSSGDTLTSPKCPFIYAGDLMRLFMLSDSGSGSSIYGLPAFVTSGTSSDYDIKFLSILYDNSDVSESYYKFTFIGRKFFDFLVSLGIKLPFVTAFRLVPNPNVPAQFRNSFIGVDNNYTDMENSFENSDTAVQSIWNYAKQKISLLPIMAFWKFYLDWVVPSRFLSNYTLMRHVLDALHIGDIDYIELYRFCANVPVSFLEDDFFTTAFSTPHGYEKGSVGGSNVEIEMADSASSPQINRVAGAYIDMDNNEKYMLNMFSLRTLGALQDMVNRGKLSGSKVKDYLEATFGIRASDDALHISSYLGSQRIPIDFESLQTTTDTYDSQSGNGSLMGQYAGVAKVSNKPFTISFDVKDKMHGYFFVTSEIQVKTSYTQGLMPEFTQIDRLDFFEPSLDAKDLEPIPRSLLANFNPNEDFLDYADIGTNSPEDIFAWVSRYASMKCNFDNVSGDYIIKSLNTGLDSWYLTRAFTLFNISQDYPEINEKFLQAISDDTNEGFDRIFSVANTSIDHFRTSFNIDLKMQRKMKSLRDSLEFEEGGKTIEKSINNGVQN